MDNRHIYHMYPFTFYVLSKQYFRKHITKNPTKIKSLIHPCRADRWFASGFNLFCSKLLICRLLSPLGLFLRCCHLPSEVKRIKPDRQEAGQSEEGLSGKQLQAKLKREANKLQKEEQKKAKKEEAARKREAQANTKKVVQLSSKLSVPLTQAVHKAHEILQKADALGLKEIEEVKEFQACVEVIEDWKKKCSSALNFYAKNPNCELAALPFAKDKDVFTSLKELAKKGTELKTMVLNPAQKEQSTKK